VSPRASVGLGASPPLVFVGGTGRSGTHVIAELLDRHPRYASVPIEARFHAKPRGFPDLLAGAVGPEEFLRKLRRFWWRSSSSAITCVPLRPVPPTKTRGGEAPSPTDARGWSR
jgi:hypothetical protein